MGALSPWHLILVLGIALIVLGPGKLPETGAAIGKAIRTFQDAVNGRDETTAAQAAMAVGGAGPAPAVASAIAAATPTPIGTSVAPEAAPAAPSEGPVG